MPDTVDSSTSAETGGRKDDPPDSQVQKNFTGTAPTGKYLAIIFNIQV